MSKIELPSGAWVEYREQLKAMDRFAVHDAIMLEYEDTGKRKTSMGIINDQRNALLGRIITQWSYDTPVPAKNNLVPADVTIGNAMDLDDYNALADAVQPLMDKISGVTTVTGDPKAPPAG